MKTKIIISLLLLFATLSFSQFNVIVEDSSDNHLYTQTIVKDSNYIMLSGAGDNYGNRGFSFIKTNSTGNIISEKMYSKSGESWYEGFNNSFNPEIMVLSGFKFTDKTRGVVRFFNSNYDTIFTKTLFYDTLITAFYTNCKTYNNNFVVGGLIGDDESTNICGCVVKYNMNGDTLWLKKYIGISDFLGKKIIETYDSSLISIGFVFTGSSIYRQDWCILKTDSLGNLKWWLHPGNPNLNDGSVADIIQTKDSCYVVVGGKAVYRDSGGEKFDGHIMKIDRNGNILWDKTYRKRLLESPYDSVYCFFNSIVELDDGGFIVAANEQIQMGGGHYNSVLYLFDSNGDTLKTKHYCTRCEYTTGGIPTQEFPTTIKKIDDGSFLIGGWGTFVYIFNHPYEQQMFLIKTDQFGCDGTEEICDTLTTANTLKTKQQNMLLYPNPAKESITINLSENNNNKEITIYDIYGRKLKQIKYVIASNSEAISINVSNLQSGVYILKVGENVAKFIKE